jgi:hypothetical protein
MVPFSEKCSLDIKIWGWRYSTTVDKVLAQHKQDSSFHPQAAPYPKKEIRV